MLLYLISFILGSSGAYLVWKKGHALGLMDKPCDRSSHDCPTPKGGGIGIFFAFVLASIAAGFSFWFWLPLVVMSIMALVGDRVELSARFRLSAQLALAALIVTLAGSGALPEGTGFCGYGGTASQKSGRIDGPGFSRTVLSNVYYGQFPGKGCG